MSGRLAAGLALVVVFALATRWGTHDGAAVWADVSLR